MTNYLSTIKIPSYSRAEEWFSSISHMVGAAMSVGALAACFAKALLVHPSPRYLFSALIYGLSAVVLYTCSSIYHGLYENNGKRIMRVVDHCSVFILIAGTYTPYVLLCIAKTRPGWCLPILLFVWGVTFLCIALNFINMEKHKVFLAVCYVGLGWTVLLTLKPLKAGLAAPGIWLLLVGGIVYTLGAIVYGVGGKVKWLHSVFHLFVIAGSILHFCSIFFYVLV